MSAAPAASTDSSKQSDLLLWVAGGVVAAVGGAWLVITEPWVAAPQRVALADPTTTAAATPAATPDAGVTEAASGLTATLDDPLRMARLAFDAGMLVEPEEYSAWTLYARVFKEQPDNLEARDGLSKVADELVSRGETALEQGRFPDARATVARVLAALPDHPGAQSLDKRLRPDVGAPPPSAVAVFRPEIPVQTAPPPVVAPAPAVVERAPAPPPVDPVVEASEAFNAAMSASRLLTPAEQSAKHFVTVLADVDAEHALTRAARQRLSQEFLSRAAQSLEALDTDAADTWIAEAEALSVDSPGVKFARDALTNQLIAMESAKPLPASALTVATYEAPVYPQRALDRGIEGWVDVEFTVGVDGTTGDVRVTDASNESYFRREAIAAVEKWRFEPRTFMGRAIEQRSYTRIRFVQ
jgi:TonB family protein